jgi:guanylate kinase
MSVVILLTGVSGAGKSTLKRMMLERFDSLVSLPSYTTRAKREGDGEDYVYVSVAEFKRLIDSNFFLEWSDHYGVYYGTPSDLYFEALSKGLSPIKDINVDGVNSFKKELEDQCVSIFIEVPSMDELHRRLALRDGQLDILRTQEVEREQSYAALSDCVIVNKDLMLAADRLSYIIEKNTLEDLFERGVHCG